MEPWIEIIIAVIASSGFWALIQKLTERKDVKSKMLIGLAHDRILTLGKEYIDRGYVTSIEYDNLDKYLYEPYSKLGGNGSAERIMKIVKQLPIHD